MVKTYKKHIVAIVFAAGVACLLTPIVMLFGLERSTDLQKMDTSAAVARASEGVNANAAPPLEDMAFLESEAAKGNAVAQNNLALILRRSPGRDNHERSEQLLKLALDQGLPQAAYNVAFYLPSRFHTEPAIVKRQLDLLRPLATSGDPHAAALMGRRLYYVNREEFEPNRESRRLELYQIAASSGDRDYKYIYARELYELARTERPDLFPMLTELWLELHELGEPRAPGMIAAAIAQAGDMVTPVLEGSQYGADAFLWMEHAADSGIRSASCNIALDVFESIRIASLGYEPNVDLEGLVRQQRAEVEQELLNKAQRHLEICYTPSTTRRTGRRNPAFGDTALYAGKVRGGWTALANSPGYARVTAGILEGFAPFDEWNPDLARRHFEIARDDEGYDERGSELLALLDARQLECLGLAAQRSEEQADPAEEQDQDHQQIEDVQCGEL